MSLAASTSFQNFQCTVYTVTHKEDSSMMKCASNTVCIPQLKVCNGNEDCEDGSDEANCDGDPEDWHMQSNRILCRRDEYRCPGGIGSCIPLDQLCDGTAHCPGGRDEDRESCRDCKRRNCGYKCRITDIGGRCYCPDGSTLNDDGRTCSPINFCQTDDAIRCQQYCKSNKDGYQCYCAKHYSLAEDGHTCHVKGEEDIHFIATVADKQITTVSLFNRTVDVYMEHKRLRVERGYYRVVEYDSHNDIAYITAYVYRTNTDLIVIVNNTEKILRRDLIGPVHTAIDHVGRNLYYTQEYHSEPGIYVCAADALFCKRIVAGKEVIPWRDYQHFNDTVLKDRRTSLPPYVADFVYARGKRRQSYGGIALNLFTGKMFWTDQYEEISLMMADMDGKNVEKIYDYKTIITLGLDVDPIKDEVYLYDSYSYSIIRMNVKTRKVHTVVSSGVGTARGLRYFDGHLYWVEWYKKTLRSAQIRNHNCTGEVIRYFDESPWGLAIKHPLYPPLPSANPCDEIAKSCPWICVIAPGVKQESIQAKCLCPDNYKEEDGTCTPDKNITRKSPTHLMEAHSYVDVDYWKELCSKGIACFNGGQCAPVNGNDTFGVTFCNCPPPFIGERCELADPSTKKFAWALWTVFCFVTAIVGLVVLYYKDDRFKEFTRAKLHRITRRNELSEVRFIADERRPDSQNSPSVSFSSPLFAT